MNDPSPTFMRIQLAGKLRSLRRAAGLTTSQVTAHLAISASKLSRIETGARPVQLSDLKALFQLYGVPESDQQELLFQADESRQQSAWLADASFEMAEYTDLEAAASLIEDYKTSIIMTLLQTPRYSEAVLRGLNGYQPFDEIQRQVQLRALRQKHALSRKDHPRFRFIVDEAALWRTAGNPGVMREQLIHLVKLSDHPLIDLRVIPFSAGIHPGMDSLFTILSFDEAIRDRVYMDNLAGPIYLVSGSEVARLKSVFARLSEMAISAEGSKRLISRIAGSYASKIAK